MASNQRFVKNGFKKPVFLSKSSKFCVVWTIWFCSNSTSMWYKHSLWNMCRDFRLLMSLLATVAGEILTANLLQKLIFRSGILCYHCWYWHWKSKVSWIHYLINIWTTCWWNLNRPHAGEIWTKLYGPNYIKFGSSWQKMINHFWESVDATLENVSVNETITWC